MKALLEDYKRRLKTITEELNYLGIEGKVSDSHKRLSTKASCYRTFITELEREMKETILKIDGIPTNDDIEIEMDRRGIQESWDRMNGRTIGRWVSEQIKLADLPKRDIDVANFVENWIASFCEGTFIPDTNGYLIYYSENRQSGINLNFFFKELLTDFIEERDEL